MSSYCSFTDLQSRLTLAGLDWAVNRDGGDTVTSAEIARYVTPGILRTDTEIDAAIQQWYDPTSARGNTWLTYIARDITVVEVCENGGRAAPESFLLACKRAREQLAKVTTGQLRIPGLTLITIQPYQASPSYAVHGLTVVNLQREP
jgi:hypothetical protein